MQKLKEFDGELGRVAIHALGQRLNAAVDQTVRSDKPVLHPYSKKPILYNGSLRRNAKHMCGTRKPRLTSNQSRKLSQVSGQETYRICTTLWYM